LGEAASEIHQKIGRKIKEICDLAIIITSDNFEDIKKEAGGKAIFENNPLKIAELIENKLSPKTAALLEGRIPPGLLDLLKNL
ncbi:hypothetical protein HY227_02515, partial [Candidatus Wolfebacteria bacterium]|nr:hypothetical protein [Candidatus Wolfebacteria bacterium]